MSHTVWYGFGDKIANILGDLSFSDGKFSLTNSREINYENLMGLIDGFEGHAQVVMRTGEHLIHSYTTMSEGAIPMTSRGLASFVNENYRPASGEDTKFLHYVSPIRSGIRHYLRFMRFDEQDDFGIGDDRIPIFDSRAIFTEYKERR